MKKIGISLSMLIPLVLAGCAGESVAPAEQYETLLETVHPLGVIQGDLPAGSATYNGAAVLAVTRDAVNIDGTVLVAQASVIADYDLATVQGELTNWQGIEHVSAAGINNALSTPATTLGGMSNANGYVALAGVIDNPQNFDANVGGSVALNNTTYILGGKTTMALMGDNAEMIIAEASTISNLTTTIDGANVPGARLVVLGAK